MLNTKITLAKGTIIRIIDQVSLKDLQKFSARILTEASQQSVGNVHGNKRITECATNLEDKGVRFERSQYWSQNSDKILNVSYKKHKVR